MNSSMEEWRPVCGFNDYAISDKGRVFSWRSGIYMKTPQARAGYPLVNLSCRSKPNVRYVHRLVLEAFVGPAPLGMEVCHNDGDRTNNLLSNLRWDSRKNNVADMEIHGTKLRGADKGNAVLTEQAVREIKRRRALGEPGAVLAREYGCHPNTVYDICKKRIWRHVD